MCPFYVWAQQPYIIDDLTGVKGPSDLLVKSIYRDADNLLWLGTSNSVERFDGNAYVRYSFGNTPVYKEDNSVNTIVCTGQGEYWAGNKFGVWKLNHETFRLEPAWSKDIRFPVRKLATDGAGTLYMGTSNGLYVAGRNRTLRHLWSDKGRNGKDNQVLDLDVQAPGKVWWLVADGVVFCNTQTGSISKYTYTDSNQYGAFTCLQRVGDILYLGTEKNGLVAFDLKSFTYTPVLKAWTSLVTSLSYDAPTAMLGIGTSNDGIYLYSLKEKRVVYTARYVAGGTGCLLSNSISSILLFGRDIWVGTNFYLGWNHLAWHYPLFNLYANGSFSTANIPVRSFLHTDGYTFIGTREGFYVADERTRKTSFHAMGQAGTKLLRSNLIFSFYKYGDTYFIGTCHGGLYTFEPRTGTVSTRPEFQKLQNSDIFMFLTDEHGVMWLATLDGLFSYDVRTRQLKGYTPSNSNLPGDIVYGILLDSHRRFWVATNKGIALFDRRRETFTVPSFAKSLFGSQPMEVVYEDRQSGALFFISLKGELFTVDRSQKKPERLLRDMDVVVENIMQDRLGNYWLGTNRGVMKADRSFKKVLCYSNTDECPSFMANPGTPMVEDRDGRIWFANVKGLFVIEPRVQYTPPKLRITDAVVEGSTVTFHFSRVDCGSLAPLWMEYQLEGYDTSWKSIQGKGELSYSNLPPGDYIFKVRRVLDNSSLAEVEVHISYGWRWVWLVLAVLALGSGCWLYRYRNAWFGNIAAFMSGKKEKDKTPVLLSNETGAEFREMAEKIRQFMEQKKPFLDGNFKQSDLAKATGYSVFLLSRMFNLYLKTGYYDFVNKYRVEEFKRLVAAGWHKTYTLSTLAQKCGFKSQASFFRVFKKYTGMTPNNYINRQENVSKQLKQ